MNIQNLIDSFCDDCREHVILLRRDFHLHAEFGFTEFRTASRVARELLDLGFQVLLGEQANRRESMVKVPPPDSLVRCLKRALQDGADPEMVKAMEGGLTGVVGILNFGPGPVLALRFDMDANELTEASDSRHRPCREGFASKNPGASHGCGHDGHTAMGLGVARVLSQMKKHLRGTIKLIFQPAEEGMRGARPMMDAGVVDDVDYFLFPHLGLKLRETGVIATTSGILCTTKLDIDLQGVASHPLASPETGRNALLAASTMALAIHALPPMGEGSGFRTVNVGILNAGVNQSIVAPNAHLEVATFADRDVINTDLVEQVRRIIDGTKTAFGVSAVVRKVGESFTADCDPEMVDMVKTVASQVRSLKRVAPPIPFGATEDATFFMRKVQERGGKACGVVIGTELSADHHNPFFDFDEKALDLGTRFLSSLAGRILSEKA